MAKGRDREGVFKLLIWRRAHRIRCAQMRSLNSILIFEYYCVFPILAHPVDVKKGDQLCQTVSQPSIQPDGVNPPMGS